MAYFTVIGVIYDPLSEICSPFQANPGPGVYRAAGGRAILDTLVYLYYLNDFLSSYSLNFLMGGRGAHLPITLYSPTSSLSSDFRERVEYRALIFIIILVSY